MAQPIRTRSGNAGLSSPTFNRPAVFAMAAITLTLSSSTFAEEPAVPPPTLVDAYDLYMGGSYDDAVNAYQTLTADASTNLEATLGLIRCRLHTGKTEEAASLLKTLDAPTSPKRHELTARLLIRLGQYDEAFTHLKESIKLDAKSPSPRRALGELLDYLGRREQALETYQWFDRQLVEQRELPRNAEQLTDLAVGFYRYSVLTKTDLSRRTNHVLREMLQPAYSRLDRSYWPARIAAGDLLRQKFNNDEADGSVSDYQAALRINPHLPEAEVGLGEVALENWNFELVEEQVKKALETDPNYAPALHLLAKKFIVERRYEQAQEPCEQALKLNPNDLAALSISSAAYACRYDQPAVDRLRARVEAINTNCALFHRTLADTLGGIRQYKASEREYLRAIELDPTDANARTELGMMYMQWGPEDKARDALDAAWALDPYNERTKFTLELLDRLHKFARHETEHFIIKFDPEKDPGLGAHVAGYLENIYDTVTSDFETPLRDKTIIEFFPTSRSFAVRITGKPWIHTVGASTGQVIALAAPRDSVDLMGRYNLARVLKHEFTHTVTLAATENRIPHWFTEGLAVYQEDAPRSFDWCEMLADAVRRNRLFTLESIDWGFMRPKRPSDRQMAYAQSEWMVEFIVDRFGYDVIQDLIKRYKAGQTQARAISERFKLELSEFDRQFAEWARQDIARWPCRFDLSPPGDLQELRKQAQRDDVTPAILGRLARAELEEEDHERAMSAARRALEKDPDERNALEILGGILAELSNQAKNKDEHKSYSDQALPLLERLVALEPQCLSAQQHLAEILLHGDEPTRAEDTLKKLQNLCPADPLSWRGLAGIYLKREDESAALPQLIELARIEQNDPEIPWKAGKILWKRGEPREALYWLRQALAIDPGSCGLHQAMGDVHTQLGEAAEALRDYTALTIVAPTNPRYFELAATAAAKLGDKAKAKDFARRAVELDPNSSAKALSNE